ncbi:MAG TPA: EAL domain-containing protein [Thermoleophilaceae bacterium]
MPRAAASWSTQQLAELLALVSSFDTVSDALERGLERVSEALESEYCAIVSGGLVEASSGFAAGDLPVADLVAIAEGRSHTLAWGGLVCTGAISVPLEDGGDGRLVLARVDAEFTPDEMHLVRGMARVLALATRMLGGVEALRERQTLLERLSRIQRSIVQRAALSEVLDGIVTGAAELLGDEVVGLRLVEPHNPSQMALVASAGISDEMLDELKRARVGDGVGGRAIADGRLVVEEHYQSAGHALEAYRQVGLQAAMAAPVHENGVAVGSLVVASFTPGRTYSATEQEVLVSFAEHASLALTDARNFEDAMHQAFHDSLTGLPNRALFLDRLEHAVARARRTGSPVAVVFLDLDDFKKVNDRLGHVAGDELLVLAAGRLRRCCRPSDTAARFGGDEFALLLEDMTHDSSATIVAARVLSDLSRPFQIQGQEIAVSASVGIASSRDPAGGDLLRNADLAMYRAKSGGKGHFEVFEPGMHAAVMERLELEVDLHSALHRCELEVHFQPIVDLASGVTSAMEALLRWKHPTRGYVGPDEFVPLAEETGAIHGLGQWILLEACRQGFEWNSGICKDAPIAVGVNLSGKQLEDPGLVDQVSAALEQTGLSAGMLILEITETVLMRDMEGTVSKLLDLRDLGVRLSVDDFGTGYSSLQYLRRFPLDSLKIAKSFVDGVAGPSQDAAVARAIVDLGRTFNLRVVAEGVETVEQHERLLRLGCQYGQGYLFARPAPAPQVERELTRVRMVPQHAG